jgi:hypothetical protein
MKKSTRKPTPLPRAPGISGMPRVTACGWIGHYFGHVQQGSGVLAMVTVVTRYGYKTPESAKAAGERIWRNMFGGKTR